MKRIVIYSIIFLSMMALSSCDQSNLKKNTQNIQQSTSTSTVNSSKSADNMVPLVTEEEKKKAEEQHKEATKTELFNKGDDNSGKIRLY